VKILIVHNSYQQPGGEDVVVQRESALLAANGHQVRTHFRDSAEMRRLGPLRKMELSLAAIWARNTHHELRNLLLQEKPDLAHFHNIFPLISPSGYFACFNAGVPVVQTLHNYRLLCAGGTLFRDGAPCEDCREHGLWPGIIHGCYRNSCASTAALSLTLGIHRQLGTWSRRIDCFVAPSEFVSQLYGSAGFDPRKIFVKPNFVAVDPGERTSAGDYAVFVGRLSVEKGLRTLLRAWESLAIPIPLVIVGDGPLREELEEKVHNQLSCAVRFAGFLPNEDTLLLIKGAKFLVFPSEWYETFGLTMIEAFACGVPVICSRLGTMQEIVSDNRTGIHFTPGDSADLARKVEWAWKHPVELKRFGRAARLEYESKYTAERNYHLLINAYQMARKHASESLEHARTEQHAEA